MEWTLHSNVLCIQILEDHFVLPRNTNTFNFAGLIQLLILFFLIFVNSCPPSTPADEVTQIQLIFFLFPLATHPPP